MQGSIDKQGKHYCYMLLSATMLSQKPVSIAAVLCINSPESAAKLVIYHSIKYKALPLSQCNMIKKKTFLANKINI